jgi:hypothetical protein
MRRFLSLIPAVLTYAALSTSAQAAVSFTSFAFDTHLPGPGEVLVNNFDGTTNPAYSFSGGSIRIGNTVNQAVRPFGDVTHYEAAQFGHPFILSGPEMKSLSLYIGSLDTYNAITFLGDGGFSKTLTGTDLGAPANGSTTSALTNRQFFFTFDAGDKVDEIIFSTHQPAFEFDNIYAAVSGVPEPATWTMLILGFGSIGFMLRRQRETLALIAR